MCGRFAQISLLINIIKHFNIENNLLNEEIMPNYNCSPSQNLLIITQFDKKNSLLKAEWGLKNDWTIKNKINLINVRYDKLFSNIYFNNLLKNNKCIIPANGYYEWKIENNKKIPYFITLEDNNPFAFAGIYLKNSNESYSFSIITFDAIEKLSNIHNRMPVILDKNNFTDWLNNDNKDILNKKIINELPNKNFKYYIVSSYVNNPKNNSPECIKELNIL